jgi:hypothetical protein
METIIESKIKQKMEAKRSKKEQTKLASVFSLCSEINI